MHSGKKIPSVHQEATLSDAILEMSRKGLGMTAIVDEKHHVLGIYTDGDLRRTLEKHLDFKTTAISDVMSRDPRCINMDALAVEAVRLMEEKNISQMLVVDGNNKLVGAFNMGDLLRAKVI